MWQYLPTKELKRIRAEIDMEIGRRPVNHAVVAPPRNPITYRINPELLRALRPAIESRGPLYGGAEVKTSVLNAFSRAWRRLVADLKCDETSERFTLATDILNELGVSYRDGENNSRTFWLNRF